MFSAFLAKYGLEAAAPLIRALIKPLAFMALGAAIYLGGYWRGHASASGDCRVAAEKARADGLAADLAAATRAAERYRAEAERSASAAAANQAIIEEMRNAPADPCTVSPADADRLRRIR